MIINYIKTVFVFESCDYCRRRYMAQNESRSPVAVLLDQRSPDYTILFYGIRPKFLVNSIVLVVADEWEDFMETKLYLESNSKTAPLLSGNGWQIISSIDLRSAA